MHTFRGPVHARFQTSILRGQNRVDLAVKRPHGNDKDVASTTSLIETKSGPHRR